MANSRESKENLFMITKHKVNNKLKRKTLVSSGERSAIVFSNTALRGSPGSELPYLPPRAAWSSQPQDIVWESTGP